MRAIKFRAEIRAEVKRLNVNFVGQTRTAYEGKMKNLKIAISKIASGKELIELKKYIDKRLSIIRKRNNEKEKRDHINFLKLLDLGAEVLIQNAPHWEYNGRKGIFMGTGRIYGYVQFENDGVTWKVPFQNITVNLKRQSEQKDLNVIQKAMGN